MTALKAFLERCEELEPASMLLSRVKRRYSPFMHQQYLYWKSLLEPSVRVFIGDEIGLGKTIEASILLRSLIRRGEKRILITCFRDPLSKDFFSVDKKEVEVVVVKTQYVLSMKR
ncbi:MAG: hypothetical protein QXT07_02055 [Archaeoglobaceae archaeon]